jgi:putative transposase
MTAALCGYLFLAGNWAHGSLYLVAILAVASRKVLAFRLSNTLTADFCVEALEEALTTFGAPEISNTDQGPQFTSDEWIKVLDDAGVTISMDGKGCRIDNVFIERLWRSVKYEEVACYERTRAWTHRERCFTKDEGRSPEVGLQE